MGRGQARRATGGGEVLDTWHAEGSGRSLRTISVANLGIWKFAKNKSAAKSLDHQGTRLCGAAEKLVAASQGYDLPPYSKLLDFKTWAEEGPPKGSIYHYATRGR